jgi:hypothetical protein
MGQLVDFKSNGGNASSQDNHFAGRDEAGKLMMSLGIEAPALGTDK